MQHKPPTVARGQEHIVENDVRVGKRNGNCLSRVASKKCKSASSGGIRIVHLKFDTQDQSWKLVKKLSVDQYLLPILDRRNILSDSLSHAANIYGQSILLLLCIE